ncbi:MAG: phospho-N-acetylmuramoyl-pentapeptide-transferase [Anaerolineales bacterium]|nr:phospho-N-acetylmuramoyl-pentapeptide-transferase [Anaerolineales bacterium]
MALVLTLASVSFLLAIIWGGPFVRVLRQLGVGKQIRIEGPQSHFTKLGTPTMGGVLILAAILAVTVVANVVEILKQQEIAEAIVIPLLIMVAFGVLGGVDDWAGLRGSRKAKGLSIRTKLLWQILIAGGAAALLHWRLHLRGVAIPTVLLQINLGILYVPLAIFTIVFASNAVNFTDGLDGMAGLISATAFGAYGIIAALQDQMYLARFCFIVVGACFAFLWFNAHPAQVFMGDTGSLALGATLGVVALLSGQWLLLPLIALVPVAEVLSVVIQIAYFKLSGGKRVFKMAPIHHHFELLGWSETQVVQRFWIVALLGAMAGVALAMV